MYWFCHTLTWISHECTGVAHPENPSHLLTFPIPQGHPSTPAPSVLSHTSNLDWQSISHMVIYMFQCYSLKSSHSHLLPQSPKVCSLHLCLFCGLAYRIVITIFLTSIYIRVFIYCIGVNQKEKHHSSILAWRIPWTEDPGGLKSMGLQRVGHDWATELNSTDYTEWSKSERKTPIQYTNT